MSNANDDDFPLRDMLAMVAMHALLVQPRKAEVVAELAYDIADAMLAEKRRGTP